MRTTSDDTHLRDTGVFSSIVEWVRVTAAARGHLDAAEARPGTGTNAVAAGRDSDQPLSSFYLCL